MRPPVILITCDVQEAEGQPAETLLRLRFNYATAIAAAGGLPLLLPPLDQGVDAALDLCGGVLLSGSDPGITVPPRREGPERRLIAGALARGLPILGICHGMQALGEALGGTVRRDDPSLLGPESPHLPDGGPDRLAHPLQLAASSRLHRLAQTDSVWVNSLHRHALSEAGDYAVTARAPDGTVEAIEVPTHRFCLGVQWHPEYRLTPLDMRLLKAFVSAAGAHPG